MPRTTITVWNLSGIVVMKFTGSRTIAPLVGWVMITPLGSILETCSARAEAEIRFTRGLPIALLGFGFGDALLAGFGSQGIHGFRGLGEAELLERGLGELVTAEPGLPFFTVITRWLSSSAVTLTQVSPSHSSAEIAGNEKLLIASVSKRQSSRLIGRS